MDKVFKEIEELVRLDKGWDGYRALPVSLKNAHYALKILKGICVDGRPPPDIVPGRNGDLQLEWYNSDVKIELHILDPKDVCFWTSDLSICPGDDAIHLTDTDTRSVSLQIIECLNKGNGAQ